MKNTPWRWVVVLLIACTAVQVSAEVEEKTSETASEKTDKKTSESFVGRKITPFILSDLNGKRVALSDWSNHRAVVLFLMGTGCPIANLYLTELAKLQEQYGEERLKIIGIHSNPGLTRDDILKHAREFKVTMPVLHDADQRVADLLGATRTAEVFLLDDRRVIRYHGRVDDRFGYTYKNSAPRRHDLKEAIGELLAGNEISVAETTPAGCLITRHGDSRVEGNVTYAREISRIIQNRCHECHRPGMIGPFSLLTYDDAVEWSAMIKEVVVEKRMPPWGADPRYGHWSNNRMMPQEEADTLIAWIDSGTPLGDKKDLPEPREYAEGWVIDKPDIIFELPDEITIPADGVVPYLYFTVPTNFKEDVYIQAAEARPDNRAVVHHIIVTSRLPNAKDPARRRGAGVAGTAPGDPPMILPPGVAKKIPAGSELLFQMHYTPTGKVEKDRSQIGLVFYKGEEPPKYLARSKGIMNFRFKIPAGESNHEVRSKYTFPQDALLLSLMPHMHLRGKDFYFRATYPDGQNEILLSVPVYDFNWQNKYRFTKPLRIPGGTTIDCVAHFDNSATNPANPDASEDVRWGDQSWEEMMIGWVTFILEDPDEPTESATRTRSRPRSSE